MAICYSLLSITSEHPYKQESTTFFSTSSLELRLLLSKSSREQAAMQDQGLHALPYREKYQRLSSESFLKILSFELR